MDARAAQFGAQLPAGRSTGVPLCKNAIGQPN